MGFQRGDAVPNFGPALKIRGPICSPRSIRCLRSRTASGPNSPAVNVAVTPLARYTTGFTTTSKLPNQDIWRFGLGAEIGLTNPGSAFMALLGAGVGAANVKVNAFVRDGGASGDIDVPSSSSTAFSTLAALKFLYKVNPNFALGAGAEWVLVFSADTFSSSTQGETLSYLPVKVFLRWMQ